MHYLIIKPVDIFAEDRDKMGKRKGKTVRKNKQVGPFCSPYQN